MINEIQDIPVKDKRIPQYMSPEVQLQRAFIGAMVSALRDAVAGINITVPEDKREISLKSDTPIRVSNLDGIAKLLQAIEKKLTDLNAKEQPKIEIPSFPTAITVSNLPEVKPTDLSAISALLEDIKVALSTSSGIEAVNVDTNRVLRTSSDGYKKLLTYTASGKTEYVGMALAGTATSSETWQIQKLSYDGSDRLVSVLFAQGTDKFTSVWDNRASYSYS